MTTKRIGGIDLSVSLINTKFMLNFTVGPVQSSDAVRAIGAEQVPYFRTEEFSELMLENERLLKKFANAPNDSKAVFMTCSGSGGMETAIMNCLTKDDKALVINGGSFGERFVELLSLHGIPFTEIKIERGKALKPKHLTPFDGKGYTAFLVQKHETSTGVHYDMDLVSEFCKRNGCFMIVDTISSFLCDPFDMAALGVGVMITGSQKALACPPGVALMILAPSALIRIKKTKCCCQYLDLKLALKNQERGQTPWTPAVGILRQINARLKEIDSMGGAETEISRTSHLASYFRARIKEFDLPFEIISESLSNAVTPLHPTTQSAYEIFLKIKNEYGMWVCPNGGDLRDSVFRVGHIGCLTEADYDRLINAFVDLREKSFI
jgi:aspartate aminotransferase-like enzyme